MEISPKEQVTFLQDLIADKLPFKMRSMAITRGMPRSKQIEKGTLYGKTGTAMHGGRMNLGWYIGYIVTSSDIYAFVTNIQATDGASGAKAREITEAILTEAGLL